MTDRDSPPPGVIPIVAASGGYAPLYVSEAKIQPRAVSGWFATWRWSLVWFTQILFYGLPWLPWNGRQAVLFDLTRAPLLHLRRRPPSAGRDLPRRPPDHLGARPVPLHRRGRAPLVRLRLPADRLHRDLHVGGASLRGRPAGADQARPGALVRDQDRCKRGGKQLVWLAIGLWTGFTFVAYFTPAKALAAEVASLGVGPWETFWMLFYGLATYGNAGYMREQVCKYMCPYARFQSAMFDRDTLIISYDAAARRAARLAPPRRRSGERRQGRLHRLHPVRPGLPDRHRHQEGPAVRVHRLRRLHRRLRRGDGQDGLAPGPDPLRHPERHGEALDPARDVAPRRPAAHPRLRPDPRRRRRRLRRHLALRAPFKADIVRDRGTLARLVDGGRIENVYRVQLMNGTEEKQRFRIAVEGLRGRDPGRAARTSSSSRPRRAGCRSRCSCRRTAPGRWGRARIRCASASACSRRRSPEPPRRRPAAGRAPREVHLRRPALKAAAMSTLTASLARPGRTDRRRSAPCPGGASAWSGWSLAGSGAGRRRRLRDDGDRLSPCRRRRGRGAGARRRARWPARPRPPCRPATTRRRRRSPAPCDEAPGPDHPLAGLPRRRGAGDADLRGRRSVRPALVRRAADRLAAGGDLFGHPLHLLVLHRLRRRPDRAARGPRGRGEQVGAAGRADGQRPRRHGAADGPGGRPALRRDVRRGLQRRRRSGRTLVAADAGAARRPHRRLRRRRRARRDQRGHARQPSPPRRRCCGRSGAWCTSPRSCSASGCCAPAARPAGSPCRRRDWHASPGAGRCGSSAPCRHPARAGLVGACWTAMPCGLLQSALLVAALASGALPGAAVMAAFALASTLGLWLAQGLWSGLQPGRRRPPLRRAVGALRRRAAGRPPPDSRSGTASARRSAAWPEAGDRSRGPSSRGCETRSASIAEPSPSGAGSVIRMRLKSGRNESSPCRWVSGSRFCMKASSSASPVGLGQDALRQRQDLDLLDPHVVQVGGDVGMHPRLELGLSGLRVRRLAHHLQREHVVLQVEHGAMARLVVAIEPIEHRRQRRAAPPQQRKEQGAFLGVMHLLRKLVDVEEHRPQHLEVGVDAVAPALGEQQADRAEHGGERAVLGADDLDGGMGSHRRTPQCGEGSPGGEGRRRVRRRRHGAGGAEPGFGVERRRQHDRGGTGQRQDAGQGLAGEGNGFHEGSLGSMLARSRPAFVSRSCSPARPGR